jgi:hypothetical protein
MDLLLTKRITDTMHMRPSSTLRRLTIHTLITMHMLTQVMMLTVKMRTAMRMIMLFKMITQAKHMPL